MALRVDHGDLNSNPVTDTFSNGAIVFEHCKTPAQGNGLRLCSKLKLDRNRANACQSCVLTEALRHSTRIRDFCRQNRRLALRQLPTAAASSPDGVEPRPCPREPLHRSPGIVDNARRVQSQRG